MIGYWYKKGKKEFISVEYRRVRLEFPVLPPGIGRKERLGNTEEERDLVYKYKLGPLPV